MEAGATIAIWSSGEAEHKPKEGQYVMKVSLVTDPMQDLPFVENVLQCILTNLQWLKDYYGSINRTNRKYRQNQKQTIKDTLMFLHPLQNLETLGASEYTVMSQEGTWKMGDSTATVLYTKEDQVVATRDTHREKESAGSSRFA